jgi:hypothetical protein
MQVCRAWLLANDGVELADDEASDAEGSDGQPPGPGRGCGQKRNKPPGGRGRRGKAAAGGDAAAPAPPPTRHRRSSRRRAASPVAEHGASPAAASDGHSSQEAPRNHRQGGAQPLQVLTQRKRRRRTELEVLEAVDTRQRTALQGEAPGDAGPPSSQPLVNRAARTRRG